MIELFRNNDDLNYNGIILEPSRCELEMNINGVWQLELEYNIKSDKAKYIREENKLRINGQLYRINHIAKTDDYITAFAVPIFLDAQDEIIILNKKFENQSCKSIVESLGNNRFKVVSDVDKNISVELKHVNIIEAINGMQDESILNKAKVEIKYDNYTMYVVNKIGSDKGYRLEFGYNIDGVKEEIDKTNTITRIYPVAYDGTEIDEEYVDSPRINDYDKIYAKIVKFNDMKLLEDDSDGGFINADELKKAMIERCKQMYQDGVDKPRINYTIDILDLKQFKGFEDLPDLGLGDTVSCLYKPLDIETTARVIRVVKDCVTDTNLTVELGDYSSNFIYEMAENTQRLTGQIDEVEKTAYSLIEKNDREIRLVVAELETDTNGKIDTLERDANGRIKDLQVKTEAEISVMSDQISHKVSRGNVSSELNQESDRIYMRANRIVIDSSQFELDEWGNAIFSGSIKAGVSISSPVITGGVITGATIQSSTGDFKVRLNGHTISGTDSNNRGAGIVFMDGFIGTDEMHANKIICGNMTDSYGNPYISTLPKIHEVYSTGDISAYGNYDDNIIFNNTGGNSNGACCGWVKDKISSASGKSDLRIKENIKELEIDIDKYKKIRPVEFDFKENKKEGIGLIAQELQEIYPNLITHEREYLTDLQRELTDGDMLEIKYGAIPIINLKIIQQLINRIEVLERRLGND